MTTNQKTESTYYVLSGQLSIKGIVKNGLDSSTLINIIVAFAGDFNQFKKGHFAFPPNLFYYHEISVSEVIGVLINQYHFTKIEAKEAWQNLCNTFLLEKITRESDNLLEQHVQTYNQRVVEKTQNQRFHIGPNDVIIIAGFLAEGITIVHSGDTGFLKTCEELGLNIIPLAKSDRIKETEIKQWMMKRKF